MKKRKLILAWLASILAITLIPNLTAAVTTVAYWRLGEIDPSPQDFSSLTNATLNNVAGGRSLVVHGGPLYRTAVSTNAGTAVGSAWCLYFNTNNANYGTNALVSTLTDNFGIELWVKSDTVAGSACLAYNGNSGANGWGLYRVGANYRLV